jgi:hypothetical protein
MSYLYNSDQLKMDFIFERNPDTNVIRKRSAGDYGNEVEINNG